jgi:hypothetical protein
MIRMMKMSDYIRVTFFLVLAVFIFTLPTQAQTTYNITTAGTWSAGLPANCANCTINISAAATLTIDEAVTCQNCVFKGGSLSMTDQTLNIQYAGSLTTTVFNGVAFTIYGDNAKVIVNAPLSLTSSTFTFYNASNFNTSYQVDLDASRVYLYDNSSMYSTGSASTTINLNGSSQIVIGNGSQTSKAIFTVSGPTVNMHRGSSIALGNDNNVYFNWAAYNTYNNNGNGVGGLATYSTSSSTLNCGGSYPHACASPFLYGPATLSTAGTVPGNPLPVVLVGFTAEMSGRNVQLNWNTKQEVNASHFEIERSADGNSWSKVGTVQAVGNSSMQSDYSFTDQAPLAGANYYRLKMVDLDNRNGYTEIKVVRSGLVNKISYFPNPARDFVNVGLGDAAGVQVTVRLISQTGQVLQEKRAEAGNGATISLPIQQVPAGLYILSVTGADGSHESSKLMISRS